MAEIKAQVVLDTKQAESQLKQIESTINSLSKQKIKLEAEKRKLDSVKNEIKEIDSTLNTLNGKRIHLQADASKYEKVQKEIREINNEIKSLEAQKLRLQAEGKPVDDITNKIKQLKAQKLDLQVRADGLKDAYRELQQIDKQISNLTSKRATLQAKLENGEQVEQELNRVNQELDQANGKRAEMLMELLGAKEVQSNLQRIKSMVDNMKNATMKIRAMGDTLEGWGQKMFSAFSFNSNTPIGKFAHFLTQGIGYSALYRGVTAGINAMNDALSGSVERFDAIRRGTNVLKNLRDDMGIAYDDSQIDRLINGVHKSGEEYDGLADRILGLPTTLDDAVSHTTDLVAVTKDMDYSADLYTALNDAVLSFGGNEENVTRVMNQFIKSLGTGTVDGRAFNAMLQNKMTPALQGVADLLGFENAGELQEALSKGTVSAQEFADALIDLDKNGSDGMDALRETVFDSVDTISGSMQVLKARLTAGFTEVITAINDVIGDIFGDDKNLIYWIKQFGTNFKDAMRGVADSIREHKEDIANALDVIKEKFQSVWNTVSQFDFGSFFQGILDMKPVFDVFLGIIKEVGNALKEVMTFIGGGDFSKGLGRSVAGWYLVAGGLTGAGKALKLISGPLGTVIGLMQSMGRMDTLKEGGFLANLFSGTLFKPKTDGATKGADEAVASVQQTLFSTEQLVAGLKKTALQFVQISALAGEIAIMAKAINYASEQIPDDYSMLAKKMLALVGVIGTMEIVSTAIGKWSLHTGFEDIVGDISIMFGGGALLTMAKGLAELDSALPDDTSKFGDKLAILGIAITEMAGFASIIGGLEVATGGVGALVGASGLASIVAIGKTLKSFAKSMQELNKVKTKGLKEKITAIKDTITAMGEITVDQLASRQRDWTSISSIFKNLKNIAKELEKINDITIDNEGVKATVETLKEIIKDLNGDWGDAEGSDFKPEFIENTKLALEQLNQIPDDLKTFQEKAKTLTKELDQTAITEFSKKVDGILTAMNQAFGMGEGFGKKDQFERFQDNSLIQNVNEAIKTLVDVSNNLKQLGEVSMSLQTAYVNDAVRKISSALEGFKDNELEQKIKYIAKFEQSIAKVNTAIQSLNTVANDLKTMGDTFRSFRAFDIADGINNLSQALGSIDAISGPDSYLEHIATSENLTNLSTKINALLEVVQNFQTIQGMTIDTAKITELATNIKDALAQFTGLGEGSLFNAVQLQMVVQRIQEVVTTLQGLAQQLQPIGTEYATAIGEGFASYDLAGKMTESVNSAIEKIKALKSQFTTVGKTFATALKNGFSSNLNGMGATLRAQAVAMALSGYGSFRSAGVTLGNALVAGIQSSLDKGVTVQVTASTSASSGGLINAPLTLGRNVIDSIYSGISSIMNRSQGGTVNYLARGGMLAYFEPKGTDTVPAMLTPGEFVIQRKAVNTYGSDFFKHLNAMDIEGAFRSITNTDMGTAMGSVSYTNITNNNTVYNDHRSVDVHGSSDRAERIRASRYMRGLMS